MSEEKAVKLCKHIWWRIVWTLRRDTESQKQIMTANRELSHEYMIAEGRVNDNESYIKEIKTQADLV